MATPAAAARTHCGPTARPPSRGSSFMPTLFAATTQPRPSQLALRQGWRLHGASAATAALGSPDSPAPLHPGGVALVPRPSDDPWQRLQLVDREMELAVRDEQYATAARLRDERAVLLDRLSPSKLLLLHHLKALHAAAASSGRGTAKHMTEAAAALGRLGDRAALPALFALLGDQPAVAEGARQAMAQIRAANSQSTKACSLTQRGSALLLALSSAAASGGSGSASLAQAGRAAAPPRTFASANDSTCASNDSRSSNMQDAAVEQAAAAAALELFSDAILLDPSSAAAHVGRGCLLYRLGGYAAAAADLETAVCLDPWHWPALRMLALARGQLHDWSGARAALAAAAAGCPGLPHQPEFKATQAVLVQWEEAEAAWRERFEAARESALLEEGRQQLEALLRMPIGGEHINEPSVPRPATPEPPEEDVL